MNKLKLWDYKIKKGWNPKTKQEIIWFLERKINYDDWNGIKPSLLKKYYKHLKIDPGKKLMLQAYFKKYK